MVFIQNQIAKYGLKDGNIKTYFDDPRDQEMIRYGYHLYWDANNKYSYYKPIL